MEQDSSNDINNNTLEPKANAWALLPMGVFLVIYIGMSVAIQIYPFLQSYFSSAPIVPAFVIALIFAMSQNFKVDFQAKLGIIGRGIGNSSIIYMIIIFIFVGIFAGTVGQTSASSVAYFLLSIIPSNYAILVVFVVSCLVSLAMGTSVGSVTLMTPIAITVSNLSGQDLPLCVACAIGGSMFGDNLSMISDTAIAACTGLGCSPREKFTENCKMVIPVAVICVIILFFTACNNSEGARIDTPYNLIDFIPYLLVLILSIFGINVLVCLTSGILVGMLIMVLINHAKIVNLIDGMASGMQGMYEIMIITILVAAISELIKENGGFVFILNLISKYCKSKKMAQFGTGIMLSIVNIITANNTVAIVVSSPIAKEVSSMYSIRRRRMASIIDTFSCVVQGILPYGAQMMIALLICKDSTDSIQALDILPYCIYQYILAIVVVVFIFTGLSDIAPTWAKKKVNKNV